MKNTKEHTDITLEYYNNNASAFTTDTQNVDFSEFQKDFLRFIPDGGLILDLGCGAGRDSKAFIDAGYSVDAVDGSEALCKIAESHIGKSVTCTRFQDFEPQGMYDGIWACASLLHLNPDEISELLKKLVEHLKPSGYMYLSFKYGEFAGFKSGRFFQNMTEGNFRRLLQAIPSLHVVKETITGDVRPGRENEQWLNIIISNTLYKEHVHIMESDG
ncbi:MAG: class I SAM-dependent methyltransferase [Akkermansia sp.]|nr:class I SAM-dependent methyltransferase [Akkermansia sp.]